MYESTEKLKEEEKSWSWRVVSGTFSTAAPRHLPGLDLHNISMFIFESQLDSKAAAPDVTAQLTLALQCVEHSFEQHLVEFDTAINSNHFRDSCKTLKKKKKIHMSLYNGSFSVLVILFLILRLFVLVVVHRHKAIKILVSLMAVHLACDCLFFHYHYF